jgi:hypothetical protein
MLWRAIARLSPRPAWRRFKVAAQTVQTRIRVDLRPFAQMLTGAAEKTQALTAAISRRVAGARWTRIDGTALLQPLFAIPGGIAAVFALALWLGPELLSDAAPDANEMITSAAIETPELVDVMVGIPAIGIPVPAPTLLRAEPPKPRPSRAARPKPARAAAVAPKPAQTTATAPSNGPKFHGTLSISSEPLGALVWVDGELIGPTPVVLKKVAAGSVVVRIESGGYERWSSAARVVANKETSILASLQRGSDQ